MQLDAFPRLPCSYKLFTAKLVGGRGSPDLLSSPYHLREGWQLMEQLEEANAEGGRTACSTCLPPAYPWGQKQTPFQLRHFTLESPSDQLNFTSILFFPDVLIHCQCLN